MTIRLAEIDPALREAFIRYRRAAREHHVTAEFLRRAGDLEGEAIERGRCAMMSAAAERELNCPRWGAGA